MRQVPRDAGGNLRVAGSRRATCHTMSLLGRTRIIAQVWRSPAVLKDGT